MVVWASSVSISCFKVQSSIGHLVWFFDSRNSKVSGAKLWCPCSFLEEKQKMPRLVGPYINLSSNTLKKELKATLKTDWILNLPLTKYCDKILLLKRQHIRFYSDFWIHLRKLKAQWIPLTSSCSHQLPKSKVRNQKCKNVSTKKYHPMLLDKKDVPPDNNVSLQHERLIWAFIKPAREAHGPEGPARWER